MTEKSIQEHLFQQVKERLPTGASLADAIADVLHVSPDSAYRRIRGETPLILEEAKTLCHAFHLSLGHLFQLSNNSVVFENVDVSKENDFKAYLTSILQHLHWVASCKEKKIIYLATDITVFYYFLFKPVFAFRYFFWMRSVLQHPAFQQRRFSVDCLPPDVYEMGKEILSAYAKLTSIEIWNAGAVNSFLLQISNYRESGIMESASALAVYESLQKTLEHVRLQAEHGSKFLPGEAPRTKKENYTLFYNRSALGDNSILVLHDGKKTVYLNYDVLNYMMTQGEVFCNSVHEKLQLIMRKSTLISAVSEKQRTIFFNTLSAKIPTYQALKENSVS